MLFDFHADEVMSVVEGRIRACVRVGMCVRVCVRVCLYCASGGGWWLCVRVRVQSDSSEFKHHV